MAFSEIVKLEAKRRAAFHCVICQRPFVEVHHIIPAHAGGSDDLSNAAPLCAGCHDLYGENPAKRKQIRQMRDYWYDVVEKRTSGELGAMFTPAHAQSTTSDEKGLAICHCVYYHEDFETTADILFKLVKNAQKQYPAKPRVLYLDIEGHRDKHGKFDHDMFELQNNFIGEYLIKYLTRAVLPLAEFENCRLQNNDIQDVLRIFK